MRTFVLVNFSHKAYLIHIYGKIQAEDAYAAARSIGSVVISTSSAGTVLNTRYYLRESVLGSHDWFLEEVREIASRPVPMDYSIS